MADNEKLKEELKMVFDSVAGVEETEGYDTFYDEDNVPILDVLKYEDKTVLWFHTTDNKYEFNGKVVVNELLN